MKKGIFAACVFLSVLMLLLSASARPEQKLTILMYLCGSNLESNAGSASADLQEIMGSDFDAQSMTVLVMAGGTRAWDTGYDPEEMTIAEVRPGRQLTVSRMDKMNMGNAETLESFLRFGVENYPAEQYALILWDHGAGPMEGVCWDELFSMDNLSLEELTDALEGADMRGRLAWIGFDACLMSSLEVANALSPYADYMIASQETEPAFGWNYSFLNGMNGSETGKEIGKRIVDAYFEGREDASDVLTLACIDLAMAKRAAQGLSSAFSPLEHLTWEQFVRLSEARQSVMAFGEPVRAFGELGYDLVDAHDLLEKVLAENASAAEALSLLEHAVVYSRSNTEKAGGLSLYHPYVNREKYLSKWKAAYRRLGFNDDYVRYTEAFAAILTGERLLRWRDLETVYAGKNAQGSDVFALPLTSGQKDSLVSAQLLILCDTQGEELGDSCVVIAAENAFFNEQGILTAAFDGQTLYAESGDGSVRGPISFVVTGDGREDAVLAEYIPKDSFEVEDMQPAFLFVDHTQRSGYAEILRKWVWDEATQSFTNRLELHEEHYRKVMFGNFHRIYPAIGEDRILPAFEDWSVSQTGLHLIELDLPDAWRFRFMDGQLSGKQLYALFQITDAQQNQYCSIPCAIENAYRTPFSASFAGDTPEPFQPSLTGTVVASPMDRELELNLSFTNPFEEDILVQLDAVRFNGERYASLETQVCTVGAGEAFLDRETLDGVHLTGIPEIRTIAFEVTWQKAQSAEQAEKTLWVFQTSGIQAQALYAGQELLGEGAKDGLHVTLLGMEANEDGGYDMTCLVENRSGETAVLCSTIADGLQLESSGYFNPVLPETSQVLTVFCRNDLTISSVNFSIPGGTGTFYETVLLDRLLERNGISALESLSLVFNASYPYGRGAVHVPIALKKPWMPESAQVLPDALTENYVFPPADFVQEEETQLLAENNQYRLMLCNAVVGENEIVLSLRAENKSDRFLTLETENGEVNGREVWRTSVGYLGYMDPIAPHAVSYTTLLLSNVMLNETEPIQTFSFSVLSMEQEETESVRAEVKIPCALGEQGGVWLNPDDLIIHPVLTQDADGPEGAFRLFEERIQAPDHAGTFGAWLEAPVTEQQKENFEEGICFLVRPTEKGYLQMVYGLYMKRDALGNPGADFPGLIAGIEEAPGLYWYTSKDVCDGQHIRGRLVSGAAASAASGTYSVSEVAYELDLESNEAVLLGMETEGEPFADWTDLTEIVFETMEIVPDYTDSGALKHASELFLYSGPPYALDAHTVETNHRPLHIELRPIEEEDQVYVLFSIREKSGEMYSLELVPYSELAGGKLP